MSLLVPLLGFNLIQGKSEPQQVRSHAQARDLGPARQALEKRLDGTRGKGATPRSLKKEQRVARLHFRTLLQICSQGVKGDLAILIAFSFARTPERLNRCFMLRNANPLLVAARFRESYRVCEWGHSGSAVLKALSKVLIDVRGIHAS
jgi:hypothetical protein